MRYPKHIYPIILNALTTVKLGGGDTSTSANFKLPADAKCILGIKPLISSPAGKTATEALMAKVSLDSDSNTIKPFEVLCAPVGSYLGADGVELRGEAPIYPANIPVKGGSEIQVYATGLIDHTIEPYVGVDLILADYYDPNTMPRIKAKLGTLTTMGAVTADYETKGSGIRIEGGRRIIELNGFAVGTTVAAAKGIAGRFRLSSAGFKGKDESGQEKGGMGDPMFGIEPVGGAKTALDAAGTPSVIESAMLTRSKELDIPITDPIDIDDYFKLAVAITTAGKFIVGVLYL
jgi:hypothetical protein